MHKPSAIFLSMFLPLASINSVAEPGLYGIYSNLSSNAGHHSGMEMFILDDGRPGKCYQSVLFQIAEGSPQYPELLDCCTCSASHIVFNSKKWGKFIGRIDNNSLVGEFIDSKHKIKLKKGQSYWQKQ
jgi:hypothetical protein